MDRLLAALTGLMQSEGEVAAWISRPNAAFEGSTPLQVIERGETDRLWQMVDAVQSGEPG